MAIDGYSVQVSSSLLDGTTTALTSPGAASTGDVGEAFGGFPFKLAASASAVNLKLGTLTDPKWLAVYGEAGVSFQIASGGQAIRANPFAFLADVTDGLGISEIWLSNSEASEVSVQVLAAE